MAGLDARVAAEGLGGQKARAGLQAPVDGQQIVVLVVEGFRLFKPGLGGRCQWRALAREDQARLEIVDDRRTEGRCLCISFRLPTCRLQLLLGGSSLFIVQT